MNKSIKFLATSVAALLILASPLKTQGMEPHENRLSADTQTRIGLICANTTDGGTLLPFDKHNKQNVQNKQYMEKSPEYRLGIEFEGLKNFIAMGSARFLLVMMLFNEILKFLGGSTENGQ